MHKHASSNRFFRLVWSRVHSCWVVVAEGTRGHGKGRARRLASVVAALMLPGAVLAAAPPATANLADMAPPPVLALPTGAEVVAGQASISSAGNQMTVLQGSDKAILNWQSFDIGANAGVRFVQPSAQSVTLNRVLGNDPSRIFGQLSANGKVFLVNGSGVLFGASARVDVGGLVASSLDLPDNEFMSGGTTFRGGSGAGAVRNEGSIRSADGGYVALLAPTVVNDGSIVAPNGSIGLGAGTQVALDLRGDGLITLRVDRGALDALAANGGLLQADGGRVELAAHGADALARATVNNSGIVQARGLVADGGSIRLVADGDLRAGALDVSSAHGNGGQVAVEGGAVLLDGVLDARGEQGGRIDVSGGAVQASGATLDASGSAQGGLVRIGGAFQGGAVRADAPDLARFVTRWGDTAPIASSASTVVDAATTIRVDASGAAGQGGTAVVWSERDTTMLGTIQAGGAAAGGTVEISSKDLLRGVDTGRIALGAGGHLLLDPKNISIGAGGASTGQVFGSDPAADVTLDAAGLAATLDAGASVTLQANNDIVLGAGTPILVSDGSGNGVLRLQAGRSIRLDSSITTGNANLSLVANETAANGVVDAYRDGGAATIGISSGAIINAGSGRVEMTIADGASKTNRDSGAITLGGALRAGSTSIRNFGTSDGSDIVIGAAGGITGTGNGLIEIAITNGGSTFTNNAGAGGLNPGAGRYLVYSTNPGTTLEGVSGYNKHYSQTYGGAAPTYAGNGNWFLYSIVPVMTVNASAQSRVYDGTTNLVNAAVIFGNLIDGDTLEMGFISGNPGLPGFSKNVGTYSITQGTITNSRGYAISFQGTNFSITPRTLNATVVGVNKTYDGNASASVSYNDNRVAGDNLSYTQSAAFADKQAGNGKTVSVSGITLRGADAGNYVLAVNAAPVTANITPRLLTITASAASKTYDGNTAASFTLADNRIAGDVLAYGGAASASFNDKAAGAGKPVLVSGLALSGQDAANYQLAGSTVATTANIDRRILNASVSVLDKIYDGGTGAQYTVSDDRVAGDVLALGGSASFATSDAGSARAVSVAGMSATGQDAGNYTVVTTSTNSSAAITPRALTASLNGGVSKVYDGNTGITLAAGQASLDGFVAGQGATVGALDARFDNANVLQAQSVVAALPADAVSAANGTLLSNYVLPASVSGAASITPRTLAAVVAGVHKTYDGNTGITLAPGQVTLDGFVAGQGATVGALDAQFDNANVLQARSVLAALPAGAVSAGNGTLLSNYVLPASASGAASITPKALTVTGLQANAKVYDGSTGATLASIGALEGLVAGDSLQLSGPASARFDNRNAGSGKTVTASGYAIADGATGLASNYTLADSASATNGRITQATLTVKADDASRAAGLPNPAFGYSVSGLVAGDTAAILPRFVTASTATANSAPGRYAITVASPAPLQNYQLAYVDGVLDVVGAAPELGRVVRAAIAPVLPAGALCTLPRPDALPRRERPLPEPLACSNRSVVALSGTTDVVVRDGGVRTAP